MLNRPLLPAVLAILLSPYGAFAQTADNADLLFRDHSTLDITIEAPVAELIRKRKDDEYLPGKLTYTDVDGTVVQLDLGIRTRGNYRLQRRVCPFPPLRLNFKKSQVSGTLFRKQDKLKLVTHCRDRSERYDQNVIREYLTYRILNSLTDISFRVRLLRVTYVDSAGKQKDRVQHAFFIEHKNRLAVRIGEPEILVPQIRSTQLAAAYSDLTSLFQFMIGNTDFSQIAGARGEDCCHNSTLFGRDGEHVYSIPYDFDMSGIVDAPYAEPNPKFKLRSVRERLYRGRCAYIDNLPATIRRFSDSRGSIQALIDEQDELLPATRDRVTDYVEDFYELIDDDKRVQRAIVNQCI